MSATGVIGSVWETMGSLLAVLAPLAAVPLTVITFYLRSLREQQIAWHTELTRRIDGTEVELGRLQQALDLVQRDYTTKEEWLREYLHSRHVLEQLTERVVRVQALVQSPQGGPGVTRDEDHKHG